VLDLRVQTLSNNLPLHRFTSSVSFPLRDPRIMDARVPALAASHAEGRSVLAGFVSPAAMNLPGSAPWLSWKGKQRGPRVPAGRP